MHRVESDAATPGLEGFCQFCSVAAAITQAPRVSGGEQVNPLQVFCGALLKKAFPVLVLLHCLGQH